MCEISIGWEDSLGFRPPAQVSATVSQRSDHAQLFGPQWPQHEQQLSGTWVIIRFILAV